MAGEDDAGVESSPSSAGEQASLVPLGDHPEGQHDVLHQLAIAEQLKRPGVVNELQYATNRPVWMHVDLHGETMIVRIFE